MIDYLPIPDNSYGCGSNHKLKEAISIRDLDTQNERLKQVAEVQKGELHRLRLLLGWVPCALRGGTDRD
jgi:hypothetical protein